MEKQIMFIIRKTTYLQQTKWNGKKSKDIEKKIAIIYRECK